MLTPILNLIRPWSAFSQNRVVTKKRRRSLCTYSAHITENAIEIAVSVPFARRALINASDYFRFPKPKQSSTSFCLRQDQICTALVFAAWVRRQAGDGSTLFPAESLVIPGLGILDRLQVGEHVGAGQGPGDLPLQLVAEIMAGLHRPAPRHQHMEGHESA